MTDKATLASFVLLYSGIIFYTLLRLTSLPTKARIQKNNPDQKVVNE